MYAYIPFSWSELIQLIVHSVSKVKLLCVLASEIGLKYVQSQFPGVEVGHGTVPCKIQILFLC